MYTAHLKCRLKTIFQSGKQQYKEYCEVEDLVKEELKKITSSCVYYL